MNTKSDADLENQTCPEEEERSVLSGGIRRMLHVN